MLTSINFVEIMLSITSLIAVFGFTKLLKTLLYKYRRPNGKKGGLISLNTAVAFSILTVVALTTKDCFLTSLSIIPAYLIARNRVYDGQHYMYQTVLGAIIGIVVPYGIFYAYYKRIDSENDTETYYDRERYDDMPSNAFDDRSEADEVPELRLEDLEDV